MKSIVSYPDRGPYGKSSWRGNCTGRIIKDFFLQFRPRVWADVFLGGGTSQDVHAELLKEGVENTFFGLDLHNGFNILKDNFREKLNPCLADWVFLHPPYFDLVRYSGNMWGSPHPDDLSRCSSYEEFIMKMRIGMLNVWEGIRRGGRYTLLIGDLRRKGQYFWLSRDLSMIAPGRIESVLIKEQHNCVSGGRDYTGSFIPIVHETALTFIKDEGLIISVLDQTLEASRRLKSLSDANWKSIIGWVLARLGGEASLPQIYECIIREAGDTTIGRPNWQAKVRQVLGQYYVNAGQRGVWRLAAKAM